MSESANLRLSSWIRESTPKRSCTSFRNIVFVQNYLFYFYAHLHVALLRLFVGTGGRPVVSEENANRSGIVSIEFGNDTVIALHLF
jgi:hypothetical protein